MAQRRSAIVTGGSSGIGLATAQAFAARGYDVGICARDPERLEVARALVESARTDAGSRVDAAIADVAEIDSLADAFAELGYAPDEDAPDVLVNAAGIFIPGRFEDIPLDLFREHLDIDVMGVVHGCKLVVPAMVARGSGSIVNVSSVAGYVGVFGYTAYSAAKFAVIGFSESLRQELKPAGVDVSVVCPPDVDTPGLAKERSLRPPETDAVASTAKAIAPEKVADAIVRGSERGTYMIIPHVASAALYRVKGALPEVVYAAWDSTVAKSRKTPRSKGRSNGS